VSKNAHQIQFPKTPSFLTIPATNPGVSTAKVVATIEVPNNHHGMFLPERKKFSELLPLFWDTTRPIIKLTKKNAMMMSQSIVDNSMGIG
jgi:hypothetical protein